MTNFIGEAHSSSVRARALKGVALSAVTLAMVAPGFAQAQQDVQEVTITGSRIKAPNLTADSPTQSVTQEEIKQANVQAVEQLLNNLPSVTADFTAQQSSLLGSTTASVNLRGLGSTRNLVLIDGRRIGPGDPSSVCGAAADLNFLPTPLIKSVEVLTGGAAAVYGSDAVAGVVNFHLIRDFQGAELDFSYSADQHSNNNATAKQAFANTAALAPGQNIPNPPKSDFDGFIRETFGMVGSNSPDGKGNVTMYADYRSTTPVQSSARDWSACPIYPTTNTNGKATHVCAGSSTTPYGKFQLGSGTGLTNGTYGNLANNPNGTATFAPFANSMLFNFSATSYLQRQDDRAALGAFGHYEINEHADLYAEMMYMNDSSQQQDGAGGLFLDGVPGVQTTLAIPCSNPYIGHSANGTIPSQYTALGCSNPGVSTATITFPSLRFTLPRQDTIVHDDYRAVAGVRGDIDGNWTYDVSASHWQSQYNQTNANWALLPAVDTAIQNGTLNIFQYGGDTLAQQAGVTGTELETGGTKEDDAQINVTGDLGPYGGKSPFASSPVAVAAGVEYRHTTLSLSPDANFQDGYVLGGSGKVLPISGGEMVTEEYGEIRAPILQDKPFAQSLDLNLAFRHSDYTVDNSSSDFSTNTYKINADYQPMDDFRFRGGYNRAARAPNVYELFQADVYGNDSGYNDPCAPLNGAAPTLSQATCTNPALGKAGVTAAQYQNGLLQCSANQCNNYTGGNTALKPEEADTWTWGVNITPTFLPGFNASIDYWDIKVANFIGTLSGSEIVNGCYAGTSYYCQFIQRDPVSGALVGNGKVTETNVNLDSIHNTGLDVDLEYLRKISDLGLGISDDYGSLQFHLTGTYNMMENTQTLDSIRTVHCLGLYGATCGNPLPNWRHQARVTWNTPWNADFSVNWRYIGGSKLDAADPSNPAYGNALVNGSYNANGLDNTINQYNYIDLSASYKLWDKYTLRAGVNNLFDKDPPVLNADYAVSGGFIGENGNTFTMYDVMGRVLYMSFSAKW